MSVIGYNFYHLLTCRYLMSPNMEVVRCFGVEYNAEELSEEILKELKLREPPLKS